MFIEIIDDHQWLKESHYTMIQEVIDLTAQQLKLSSQSELDITIVDNETIHELNKTYRNIDRPTDVLSFALSEGEAQWDIDLIDDETFQNEPQHLGDIIISYPKIVEQAEEYGHSFERELAFLCVHGFLHLNGYDHQTKEEEAEMFGIQNKVLELYGLSR